MNVRTQYHDVVKEKKNLAMPFIVFVLPVCLEYALPCQRLEPNIPALLICNLVQFVPHLKSKPLETLLLLRTNPICLTKLVNAATSVDFEWGREARVDRTSRDCRLWSIHISLSLVMVSTKPRTHSRTHSHTRAHSHPKRMRHGIEHKWIECLRVHLIWNCRGRELELRSSWCGWFSGLGRGGGGYRYRNCNRCHGSDGFSRFDDLILFEKIGCDWNFVVRGGARFL